MADDVRQRKNAGVAEVGSFQQECGSVGTNLTPKELRAYFRDIQDHVSRLLGQIDGMRDMLTTAMQVNLALVANNQNEVVKRLAGWGAILAIPTVVFSLYDMNFEWMPELKWRAGYPMAVAVAVAVGVTVLACVVVYRRLRRAGWVWRRDEVRSADGSSFDVVEHPALQSPRCMKISLFT
jgi:Mg2+ and Co2+ transporter CorA